MKYYSEVVNKVFDTEDELKEAEKEHEEKHAAEIALKEERKQEAKLVEEAFRKANEAYKEANEKMHAFAKKYGSYHLTLKDSQLPTKSLFDLFFDNWLF